MEIVDREDKQSWFSSWFAALLNLGYGFTFGLVGNAIALVCSLFWFLPGGVDFFLTPLMILDIIVFIGLGILQLIGFVQCLIDLSRRHTYQSWIRVCLVAVGIVLNCLPLSVYILISGTQGNGFV